VASSVLQWSAAVSKSDQSRARLERFAVQVRERIYIDEAGLDEAAQGAFAWLQGELIATEGTPIASAQACELDSLRTWARAALIHLHGKSGAKRVELAAVPAPLAICMGSRLSHREEFFSGGGIQETSITAYGSGCLRAFADSTHSNGGRMWREWCPLCTPSRRKAGRDRSRAHRKALSASL
jgi:hypothetical protein